MNVREPAVLILEDGSVYTGSTFGATGTTVGEAVFVTAMTGYQETLTDPSYHRQVVIQTAPHIGNTGVNDDDDESLRYWVAGYVVRDASRVASSWRAVEGLEDRLTRLGIVGICDVDTRALTVKIRDKGAMRVGIFSGDATKTPHQELLETVRESPVMTGAQLAEEVSTKRPYEVHARGKARYRVVAYDLGIKNHSPYYLAKSGLEVHVVPAATTFDEAMTYYPDGVFFSNGPGDPATADAQVEVLKEVMRKKIPYFGICFGNQLLGRALGFGTYKLPFGHRGINQPVLDVATGRVEITAQNHGFAVDAPLGEPVEAPNAEFGRVQVSHIGLNDNVVEGLNCLDVPAFSVQFHPESAAGPHDSQNLFDRFVGLMRDYERVSY